MLGERRSRISTTSRTRPIYTLRAALPKRSPWRRAQFDTLRLRLIKIAARVVEMKSRITLHLPSACPAAPIMRLLLERLPRMMPI